MAKLSTQEEINEFNQYQLCVLRQIEDAVNRLETLRKQVTYGNIDREPLKIWSTKLEKFNQ